jgi:hypothetical protein
MIKQWFASRRARRQRIAYWRGRFDRASKMPLALNEMVSPIDCRELAELFRRMIR